MGIPENTVQSMPSETDVYETIDNEASKEGMDDMEVFFAWSLGLAAYKTMRTLGAVIPSDTSNHAPQHGQFCKCDACESYRH